MKKPIIALFGSTASGKTAMATETFKHTNSIIINADSKQIYKEIPVITAQPSEKEQAIIPHCLYGYCSIKQKHNITDWLFKAKEAIDSAHKENKIPVLVGGTGMYFKAIKNGLAPIPEITEEIKEETEEIFLNTDKETMYKELLEKDYEAINKININDTQRLKRACEVLLQTGKPLTYWYSLKKEVFYPKDSFLEMFLCPDKDEIYKNCNLRFEKMIKEDNLLEEVKKVYNENLSKKLPFMKVCGLPEMFKYLSNELTLEEAVQKSQTNTRHYIKRQFTWFRGQMPEAKKIDDNTKIERKLHIEKLVNMFLLK